MHSQVAPYPAQIWFGQALFDSNFQQPKLLTNILSLDCGGHPSVRRHSSFFRINPERDVEENSLNASPLLPAFSDQPHLKVGVVGLGLQSNLSIYEHFVHLFLWNAVFAHFAKGAEARIALWRENVDS